MGVKSRTSWGAVVVPSSATDIPGPELSGARAELSITDDVSFIGGLSHLPADLHIDSGIDLSALLGKRAHRPRGGTMHGPAETTMPPL